MPKIVSKEVETRLNVITKLIESADVTKYRTEKKRTQQEIVPNIVEEILVKRGFVYNKKGINSFVIRTTIGEVVIRCCNYFDAGMNRAIIKEETMSTARYIVVAGHEASPPDSSITYFNLTKTKRNRTEDLYKKHIDKYTYDKLDTLISSYVPISS